MSGKRTNKKHMAPPSQDFFTLGASSNQPKLPLKRATEPFVASSSVAAKKPKVSLTAGGSAFSKIRSWEEKAIIVPAIELKDKILQYDQESDVDSEEMIERLLCGAAKLLREQKTKPDSTLVCTLLYLAKIRPLFFCSNIIVEAFSSLLKRETLSNFKSKQNIAPVLVINLFYNAFHDENMWPELFIKLYLDDSLGDRVWVDHEECKDFIDILVASFKTKLPPKTLLQTSDVSNPTSSQKHAESSPNLTLSTLASEDSTGDESCSSNPPTIFYDQGRDQSQTIVSRYLESEDFVIKHVFETINDHLNRRATLNDISRNLLKLLISTAGIRNIRSMVAQKLEHWFQNPKLSRPAQDLLLTIFLNCDEADGETLSHLLKMRLKNKPFVSHFILCFKELLNQKNGTFDIVLRILLSNEISNIRHMNNMQLLSILFQQNAERAILGISKLCFSKINSNEDVLRALRSFLRDFARAMKSEPFNYCDFALALLDETKKALIDNLTTFEYSRKDKVLFETFDIVTMVMFLSVTPNIREAFIRLDRKEVTRNFQLKIAKIQNQSINLFYRIVCAKYAFEKKFITVFLNKVLILDHVAENYSKDGWPPENERNIMIRLTTEGIPLYEDTVKNILYMGFMREVSLVPVEACDIICTLIQRATVNFDGDQQNPVLFFTDVQIINLMFQCSIYNYPVESTFPATYKPPVFAIVDFYWKVWTQLMIMTAHLPTSFGEFAWKQFPTIHALVEMAITNKFQFPPKSLENDEELNKLLQHNQVEKHKILELENYLAQDHEITENNSYLISTLITFDPGSVARQPPATFLNNLKGLCSPNGSFRLGHLLCQSRRPDFLLMIIEKQQSQPGSQVGFLSSLNWLIDLVESYESNYGLLPVQCLCEFLYRQIAEETSASEVCLSELSKNEKLKKREKRRKLLRLIDYFQNNILQNSSDTLSAPFQYLIRLLGSVSLNTRVLAHKALYLIVSTNVEEQIASIEENATLPLLSNQALSDDWLKTNLVKYLKPGPQFQQMCDALIVALYEESNTLFICKYFAFIAEYVKCPNEMLALKCSQLLIHRQKIASHMVKYSTDSDLKQKFLSSLYKIFALYMESLIAPSSTSVIVVPSSGQDRKYVYVKFINHPRAVRINLKIIYGIILSLSYCDTDDVDSDDYIKLFELFLSEPDYPQIFTDNELKQQEQLIPEWLAIKLLCSCSDQIISLVLANLKTENYFQYLDSYGLSTTAIERMMQSLDKLSVSETRQIKSLTFDRMKLLNTLKIYWAMGVEHGEKFAKTHLNYKIDANEKEDVEMSSPLSYKKRNEEKLYSFDNRLETFKKDDMTKIFKTDALDRNKLLALNRFICHELLDSNIKVKKMTKLFLNEFISKCEEVEKHIVDGKFDSIFNVIITSSLKDSKRFGFTTEFTAMKKQLQSLESKKLIEKTFFWKRFERLLSKSCQKTKKSKTSSMASAQSNRKKQPFSLLSKSLSLEEFLKSKVVREEQKTSKEDSNKEVWFDTFADLAIEKYYKNEIELENYHSVFQSVIFSRNRPYFLSLLLHKSNFFTLNNCIDFILSKNFFENQDRINSTSVLDFVQICISSPKLWIGRENNSQKVDRYEDVLDLDHEKIKRLIDYVIEENDITNRIDLIVKTCCTTNTKIEVVAYYLKTMQKSKSETEKISLELYTRLYLRLPNIETPQKLNEENVALIQSLPSFIDRINHNLITSFMFVEPHQSGQITSSQMVDYWEYGLLKVASKHPLLFIRQLQMIPALLRGKVNVVHYDVFKNLNLLRIFSKLLNLLNLLQPYLWKRTVKGLEEVLNLYLEMFMAYHQLPRQKEPNYELLPLIVQFLHLVDDWVKHDLDVANHWSKQNKNIFIELSSVYSSEQHLFKPIISGFPFQDYRNMLHVNQHCSVWLSNLKSEKVSQELLNQTLSDISKFIDKHSFLGENFLNSLQLLYSNPVYCEQAIVITLKILQVNPRLTSTVISSYLSGLQNRSPLVINVTLKYLNYFVLLAQEYRYVLLSKVFELAITTNSDVVKDSLFEALKALSSQTGCEFVFSKKDI